MMKRRLLLALLLLAGLAACSTAPMNQPLTQFAPASGTGWISNGGYRQRTLTDNGSSDELLVLVASSGGGSARRRSPTACCAACAIFT